MEEMYIPIRFRPELNKVGLGFPVLVTRHGSIFLSGGLGERRRSWTEVTPTSTTVSPTTLEVSASGKGTDSPDLVLVTLDLVEFVFCTSFVFSGDAVETDFSGEQYGRLVLPARCRAGLVVSTICLDGSAPLLGSLSSGCWGILLQGASDSSRTGDVMTSSHLLKPGHSTSTKHVVDVLPKTATKISVFFAGEEVGSRERIPAVGGEEDREASQRLYCNLCIFQGCLRNMGCNYPN
ncbi:unnamed protein product [Urochloa humidicola]